MVTLSEKLKLRGVINSAEVKSLYEDNNDTNAYTNAEKTKLAGIASGAEINVQSDWNAASGDAHILNKPTVYTTTNSATPPAGAIEGDTWWDSETGTTFVYYNDGDTGQWVQSGIINRLVQVSNNNSAGHDAVTVVDSAEIDFTLTGQQITASIVAGSIDESKLDASVNASLDLADTALQASDISVSVQPYDTNTVIDASYVATENSYTTAEKNKLADIATRSSATADVINLVAGSTTVTTITLPKSLLLQSVNLSKAGWMRLYNNQSNANNDELRLRDEDPSAGSGVMLEIITESDNQTIELSPQPVVSNLENPPSNTYYIRITNDSITDGIAVTFNFLKIED